MTENDYKEAYNSATKELKEKEMAKVKEIVKNTLIKLDKLKEDKDDIDEQIKYLKLDLDDLKEGRLDRIEERQAKDPKAKKISVILVIKEKEVIREVSPWYWPYRIIYHQPILPETVPTYPRTWVTTAASSDINFNSCVVTNSAAKFYSAGTYDVNGHPVNFR